MCCIFFLVCVIVYIWPHALLATSRQIFTDYYDSQRVFFLIFAWGFAHIQSLCLIGGSCKGFYGISECIIYWKSSYAFPFFPYNICLNFYVLFLWVNWRVMLLQRKGHLCLRRAFEQMRCGSGISHPHYVQTRCGQACWVVVVVLVCVCMSVCVCSTFVLESPHDPLLLPGALWSDI